MDMLVVETLLPVILLMALGWGLAKIRFLGPEFIHDLNKLTFYVALPAFILKSMTEIQTPPEEAMRLFLLLLVCTILVLLLAPLLSWLLGGKAESLGSVSQAAFRGNLAYGALPILTYSLVDLPESTRLETLGTALLVFAPLTACYNLLAIFCLQRGVSWRDPAQYVAVLRSILTNPLLLSCVAGFFLALLGFRFPRPLHQTMHALGGVALPVALLCIGGSFEGIRFGGRYRSIWIAVLGKIVLLPLLAWLGCLWLGIGGLEQRTVLIFAAAPTAATAYTMAKEMGGDVVVTAAAVALSTILAFGTISLILLASP